MLPHNFALHLNTAWYTKISLALTSQKVLMILHQVRGQHQGMVGVEWWLQLIPLWSPARRHKSSKGLGSTRHVPKDEVVITALPRQSPAGPWTGVELERCVIADLLSSAKRPRLQDILHQVTVATEDIQWVDNRLPRLICEKNRRDLVIKLFKAASKCYDKKNVKKRQIFLKDKERFWCLDFAMMLTWKETEQWQCSNLSLVSCWGWWWARSETRQRWRPHRTLLHWIYLEKSGEAA